MVTGKTVAFFAAIGFIEYFLYFRNLNHFFQADTIHWLYRRATSWQDFFNGFLVCDISGWYRPLGNRLIPFLFFDLFGMQPAGYRIIIAILFFADTAAVFALLFFLTRNRIVAYAGTFFFAIHTVNAIVTYDVAFAPELLSILFCISSVILLGMFCGSKRSITLIASCACFIFGLWSKESCVVLPFLLVVVGVLSLNEGSIWNRIKTSLFAAKWHLLILAAYLVFAVGYLHVEGVNLKSLISPSDAANQRDYVISLGPAVFSNLDYAVSWAFNVPRGWTGAWRALPKGYVIFLLAFGAAAGILFLALLFNFRRRWLLLGGFWFAVALVPSLLLKNHFLSYYLFLPLFGISLIVGTEAEWLLQWLKRFPQRLRIVGWGALFLIAATLFLACEISIRNERKNSAWLGQSSDYALGAINELRTQFPNIRPNTTIYIINDEVPDLDWHYAGKGLISLFYKEETLRVLYSKENGFILLDSREPLLIFRYTRNHLQNETRAFQSNPLPYRKYIQIIEERSYSLRLDPSEVVAGNASATLSVPGLQRARIRIFYSINNGPREELTVQLDTKGQSQFRVTPESRKGRYQISGFSVEGNSKLYKADAAISIR